MFPLASETLPADPAALREALEESLQRVVIPRGPMVAIDDRNYPELAAIRVTLDGAKLRERPPRPEMATGATEPGLRVEHFSISGAPLLLEGAAIQLKCEARAVEIGQGRGADGKLVLVLQNAAEGSIEVAAAIADLQSVLRTKAKAAAAAQGVNVEDVRIRLQPRSERALDVEVEVRAKKLFLGATVRITGGLEIDEQLNARLRDLKCVGDGTLGTLASGFITPYLQRFDGRAFPLTALPLGELQLRDVRLAADPDLRVTAQFGHATA